MSRRPGQNDKNRHEYVQDEPRHQYVREEDAHEYVPDNSHDYVQDEFAHDVPPDELAFPGDDADISFDPAEFGDMPAPAAPLDTSPYGTVDRGAYIAPLGGQPHSEQAPLDEAPDDYPLEDAFPVAAAWNPTSDAWLEGLTPAQREAVTHVDGPLLILAGPGSGKTRVVSHRIAYLLREGVRADQILALTFTNKAADELRARVERLMPGDRVWTSTFHRLCAKLLRRYASYVGLDQNFTIYDTGDSLRALKRVMGRNSTKWERFTPDQVSKAISWAKNNLIRAEEYTPRSGSPLGSVTAEIYPDYQAELIGANAVDFDDLLLHIASLLKDNEEVRAELDERYPYVLVDEYQDTNLAQYAIVRALCVNHPNLAVTGDPDQSIYGWRGANIKNILEFEHDYPNVRVVRLEQNYRSTQRILRVADVLIQNNVRRKQKALYTANNAGAPVRFKAYPTERDEAEGIAAAISQAVREGRRRPRDIAIFYRVNALSRAFEHALNDQGVPYQIVNGVEFYQRKEIKDVLGYLALLNNPRDNEAFLRVVNTPARGIGKTSLARFDAFAHHHHITLLEAARNAGSVSGLSATARKRVKQFVELFESLERLVHQPVEEIVGYVLERTGYREIYAQSENEDDQQRAANIDELLTAARQFDERHAGQNYLEGFLEQASLVNDVDAWSDDADKVTLMTLHASKGLEFPVVYLIGLENGLLPHERSKDNPDFLEEERRLLFVGMTRAEEELQLSMAQRRAFRGRQGLTVPSSFTMELPREEMQWDQMSLSSISAPPESRPRRSTIEAEPYDPAQGVLQTAAQLQQQAKSSAADDDETLSDDSGRDDSGRDHSSGENSGRNRSSTSATAGRSSQPANLSLFGDEPDEPAAAPSPAPKEAPWGGPQPGTDEPLISPEDFVHGTVVRHPQYGIGKVIALSGSGERRQATVAFASAAGERKFRLAQSKLEIVGRTRERDKR